MVWISDLSKPLPPSAAARHLAALPALVDGGQKAPPYDPVVASRLKKLEEDAERLKVQLAEKMAASRKGSREFDRMQADVEQIRLRGELVEENLRV